MKGYKVQGTDLNSMITAMMGQIVLSSGDALQSPTWSGMKAWSARIKTLESVMYSYIVNDTNYQDTKKDILDGLKNRKTTMLHQDYFEAWNKIFGLLCAKFHVLGIYPRGNMAMMAGGKKVWVLEDERSMIQELKPND